LDLFSGIGGITKALEGYVRPVAYCENEQFAQAVLLSRMAEGELPNAPIWDDVQTLDGKQFRGKVDIIYGGFPCQDISVAGHGKGLEGERSGLFSEILRLADEIEPTFLFLENVPAITTRGLRDVSAEITKRGYDSRWKIVSASDVGAPHLRKRWWLLAYSRRKPKRAEEKMGQERKRKQPQPTDLCSLLPESRHVPNTNCEFLRNTEEQGWRQGEAELGNNGKKEPLANSLCKGLEGQRQKPSGASKELEDTSNSCWWAVEPSVGRVVDGLPQRMDRVKALGNSVVPQCAKAAFEELMGLSKECCF
jgi:DNA (cytosine-5)-methyltransferase 1